MTESQDIKVFDPLDWMDGLESSDMDDWACDLDPQSDPNYVPEYITNDEELEAWMSLED